MGEGKVEGLSAVVLQTLEPQTQHLGDARMHGPSTLHIQTAIYTRQWVAKVGRAAVQQQYMLFHVLDEICRMVNLKTKKSIV